MNRRDRRKAEAMHKARHGTPEEKIELAEQAMSKMVELVEGVEHAWWQLPPEVREQLAERLPKLSAWFREPPK